MDIQKTIAFDFDGVIHKYSKGWTSETDIYDDPVDGIKDIIDTLKSLGYKIAIVSSRAGNFSGFQAITTWLSKHDIVVDRLTDRKIPAMCYIDDRAIQFTGNVETLLTDILTFKPWNEPLSVKDFISRKIKVGELCMILDEQHIIQTVYIDHDRSFILNSEVAEAEVLYDEYGEKGVYSADTGFNTIIPTHFIYIKPIIRG